MNFIEDAVLTRVYLTCRGARKYLTSREFTIAKFALQHQPIKLIGEQLNTSPRTVNTHLRNIYEKLNCSHKYDLSLIFNSNNIDIFA